MNDERLSPELIALERRRAREHDRAEAAQLAFEGRVPGRPRGILTEAQAAARREAELSSSSSVPVSASTASRPESAPEAVNERGLGSWIIVAALAMVVLLVVWVRQRRRK